MNEPNEPTNNRVNLTQLNCANCAVQQGYESLDGLCSMCFQTLIIYPLAIANDEATRSWSDAIDRRYRVEVALGLRPPPMQSSDFAERTRETNISRPSRAKRAVVEDEEVGI